MAVPFVKVQNQAERNWNSDEDLNDAEVTRGLGVGCVCVCEC